MALGRNADMFQGEAFWHAQKAVKSPRTPLGELTTLPRSPSQLERGMGDSHSPFPTPLILLSMFYCFFGFGDSLQRLVQMM